MPLPTSLIASIVSSVLELAAQDPSVDVVDRGRYATFINNRTLPPEARVGIMLPPAGDGNIVIDNQTLPISPSTRFRNQKNLIVRPASIQEKQEVVYLKDFRGNVHRVWMVDADQIAAIKAAQKN